MRNKDKIVTSNAGTVTIPYEEYERFQAQGERISALEKQIDLLTEALRLSQQKRFGASSERSSEDAMDQLRLYVVHFAVTAEFTHCIGFPKTAAAALDCSLELPHTGHTALTQAQLG